MYIIWWIKKYKAWKKSQPAVCGTLRYKFWDKNLRFFHVICSVLTTVAWNTFPLGLCRGVTCTHLSGYLAEAEPSSHKFHTAAVQIVPCREQSFAVKVPDAVVRRSSLSVWGMMTPPGLEMGKLLESVHPSGSVGTPLWWWFGTEGLVRWDWRSVGRWLTQSDVQLMGRRVSVQSMEKLPAEQVMWWRSMHWGSVVGSRSQRESQIHYPEKFSVTPLKETRLCW